MPRKVRIQYAGAVYHVMCRGDRLEAIFSDDGDREMFLATLGQMCRRTGMQVHSYVLMGNHYHLLLETLEPNHVAGMKWFQGTYTQRFNARHRLSGHLFHAGKGSVRAYVQNQGSAKVRGRFSVGSLALNSESDFGLSRRGLLVQGPPPICRSAVWRGSWGD